MKKQNVGIGLLLLGNIVAQLPEFAAWMFAAMLGVAGLMVIFGGLKED